MRVKAARVGAIQDKADIERLRVHFRNHYENGGMYALLVTIGCNTGLRAGDLRRLTIGDFRKGDYLEVDEEKTGKPRRIYINQAIREALLVFNAGMETGCVYFDAYRLFTGGKKAPIEVKHIHKLIKQGCKDIGLEGNYGSHSLRKTFAYHAYELCHDVDAIQRLFSHSSLAVTKMYLMGNEIENRGVMSVPVGTQALERDVDYIYAGLNL